MKKIVYCHICHSKTALYRKVKLNDEWVYECSKHPKKDRAMKIEGLVDKDTRFYQFVWKHREHFCEECGKEIHECKPMYMHHVLPKSRYKYFRHEVRNIAILCYGCHGKAESAISLPKMKSFRAFESIKKTLLAEVGIDYETKTQI